MPVSGAKSPKIEYDDSLFVNRDNERDLIKARIEALRQDHAASDTKRVVVFTGERGTGKSWLLKKIESEVKKLPDTIVFFIDLDVRKSMAIMCAEIYECLQSTALHREAKTEARKACGELIKYLRARDAPERLFVILIDHVFESWDQLGMLEDFLLTKLVKHFGVLVVMAGRGQLYPWKTEVLRFQQEFYPLKSFDRQSVQQQLQRLEQKQKIPAPASPDPVFQLSKGNPWVNYLVAKNMARPIEALDMALNDMIPSPDERRSIEALCVLRVFDEERIPPLVVAYDPSKGTLDFDEIEIILDGLAKSGFAKWDDETGGYILDKDIRRLAELYLCHSDKNKWEALHRAASKLYEQWQKKWPDSNDDWQDEVEYHKKRLRIPNCKSI